MNYVIYVYSSILMKKLNYFKRIMNKLNAWQISSFSALGCGLWYWWTMVA